MMFQLMIRGAPLHIHNWTEVNATVCRYNRFPGNHNCTLSLKVIHFFSKKTSGNVKTQKGGKSLLYSLPLAVNES